jgi:hypothetical protein
MRWVSLRGVLLWGLIPRERRAPSRQRDLGACLPEPLRLATRLWGFFNLAVGYLLVCRVGSFDLRKTQHVLVLGAGILLQSLMLAHAFGRFHGGR